VAYVFVLRGPLEDITVSGSLAVGDAHLLVYSTSGGDGAGKVEGGVGDLDGDGLGDLAVAAPGSAGAGVAAGAVGLFLAPRSGLVELAEADAWLDGEAAGDGAGSALASGGDIDGDGYADLLVGSPGADLGGTDAGTVHVVLGPPPSSASLGAAAARLYGEEPGDAAGSAVASGDLNGDGRADVALGAPGRGNGDEGAAYVVYGPTSGAISLLWASVISEGPVAGSGAGDAVAMGGDATSDGLADLLVGAPGSASLPGQMWLLAGRVP
jgi:hypothetical protein